MLKAVQLDSVKDALEFLGLRAAGGNYKSFYKWCDFHKLVPPKAKYDEKRMAPARNSLKVHDSDVFKENSKFNNRTLIKKRLRNLIEFECSWCGLGEEWNGRPITLQLDHINGVWNDNRIGNLRLLCPNCHSQTSNYAGRNPRCFVG